MGVYRSIVELAMTKMEEPKLSIKAAKEWGTSRFICLYPLRSDTGTWITFYYRFNFIRGLPYIYLNWIPAIKLFRQ